MLAGWRGAFWINLAAGLVLAVVLAILSAIFNLGLLAVAAVAGFLLLYGGLLWVAWKVTGPFLVIAVPPQIDVASEGDSAVRRLRVLRRVGVHFLLNRKVYRPDGSDIMLAQLLDSAEQNKTWDKLVMEIKPETRGADNEWERYEVLGNMKSPNYISEKIDRLDEIIKKLSP